MRRPPVGYTRGRDSVTAARSRHHIVVGPSYAVREATNSVLSNADVTCRRRVRAPPHFITFRARICTPPCFRRIERLSALGVSPAVLLNYDTCVL
jgi:hypothetical protein